MGNKKLQTGKDLKSNLYKLINKECWGFVAGKGTGSVFSLRIGEKIPLEEPVDNPNLPEDIRNNESEFSLFVECVWRIDSNKKIICGAWDDNSKNGKMLKGLKMLMNSTITAVNIYEPAFDLIIEFSSGVFLKIFCDQINEVDEYDNYTFFTPSGWITVGTRSKLTVELKAG